MVYYNGLCVIVDEGRDTDPQMSASVGSAPHERSSAAMLRSPGAVTVDIHCHDTHARGTEGGAREEDRGSNGKRRGGTSGYSAAPEWKGREGGAGGAP